MAGRFPEEEWLESLVEKLNSDEKYAKVARDWEGDLLFIIEPDDALTEQITIYLDLWHGSCRGAGYLDEPDRKDVAFVLRAPYTNFVSVLKGEIQAMQAILTRKLQVKGNMVYLMRNVPTVLEFVRCCQDVTTAVVGD